MYTRHGCHLCDDAWRLLIELRARYQFELESMDIDGDPELARLYGEKVPVLVINGQERLWGRVNRVLLERQLVNERRN
jgi:glutaredoxin